MQVIKPLEITSSNFDNSILEPDVSQGEVEWVAKTNEIQSTAITAYRFDFGGGFVWAIEQSTSTVYRLDYDFNPVTTFSIAAQTSSPGGVTYQGGFVYVLDFTGNTVYKYTEIGTYTGFSFSIATQLTSANALASSDLSIYVAGATDIYIYDLITGLYLTSFPTSAATIRGMSYYDNEIFILSALGRMVYKHSSVDYSDLGSFPIYVAVSVSVGCGARDGKVYVGNTTADGIYVFSTIGTPGDKYDIGSKVVVSAEHRAYQAVAITNETPSADSLEWIDVGATNKYRAFDYNINTKSIMPTTGSVIGYTFTPGEKCTSIGLFGLENITNVAIQVQDADNSFNPIYPVTQPVGEPPHIGNIDTAIPYPSDDQVANDPFLSDKVFFDDLPATTSNPHIIVTFLSNVGITEIKIGDIAIGNARSLGVVLLQTSTSRTSYDTVTTDIFGNQKTVSRPSAEYTSFELKVAPNYADYVERILKDSLNEARVWVGDKPDEEKIFTFGYYERSPIVYSSPSQYKTTLKVRGLV